MKETKDMQCMRLVIHVILCEKKTKIVLKNLLVSLDDHTGIWIPMVDD